MSDFWTFSADNEDDDIRYWSERDEQMHGCAVAVQSITQALDNLERYDAVIVTTNKTNLHDSLVKLQKIISRMEEQ